MRYIIGHLKLLAICFIIILFLPACTLFGWNIPLNQRNNTNKVYTSTMPVQEPIPISPDVEQYNLDVTLYFLSEDGNYLVPEVRTIKKGSEKLEELVVSELIKGPAQPGHVAIIPSETKLLSVTSSNGIAFVDVSKDFLSTDKMSSKQLILMIYSIVDTLTELKGINKVQFLINGQKIPVLANLESGDLSSKTTSPAGDIQSEPIARDNSFIQNPVAAVNGFLKALSSNDLDKAYMYLSDDPNDRNRMSQQGFKDFIKQFNFSITNYTVYDYSLMPEGNKALVTVDLEAKLNNGNIVKLDKTLLRTVRLNGIWKIEWDFPFEALQAEALNNTD